MPRDGSSCGKCSQSIDPKIELYTICEGDCSCYFHAKCVGLSKADLDVLSWNIIWMCDECMDSYRRVRDDLASTSVDKPLNNAIVNSMVGEVKKPTIEDEMRELKTTVAGIIEQLAKIAPTDSSIDTSPLHSTPISACIYDGSNTSRLEDSERGQKQQNTIDEGFSLLLSNIDVSASEKDVHRLVRQSLGDPERLDITKLVSNWKRQRNVDYVSFKVVLDKRWKTKAMNATTWPKNVKFREFFSRQNDTWKPLF